MLGTIMAGPVVKRRPAAAQRRQWMWRSAAAVALAVMALAPTSSALPASAVAVRRFRRGMQALEREQNNFFSHQNEAGSQESASFEFPEDDSEVRRHLERRELKKPNGSHVPRSPPPPSSQDPDSSSSPSPSPMDTVTSRRASPKRKDEDHHSKAKVNDRGSSSHGGKGSESGHGNGNNHSNSSHSNNNGNGSDSVHSGNSKRRFRY
ncbi:hypothetical protein CXG81DRAFT_21311 [Caulochytrium protostelioides]|uniref:Uncharacterized protein n=1 Tax=Caulochytrium protostelioides TaxID=1555241 RepID=A0A4P9WZA8_9FUNG|nr:hypothetical protein CAUPRSCDRAFT_11403 [Caulochytrium protostelioides]RKO98463.1 hypothetical protein CXG81DRAFT_21311 [Caulochytrium protostelioides]|eukprot:RKO98463.1 hypothetical protein CXG81DRAFT_21311 [Caulochytrium protostelioides]